jgi:hypothetical protein
MKETGSDQAQDDEGGISISTRNDLADHPGHWLASELKTKLAPAALQVGASCQPG